MAAPVRSPLPTVDVSPVNARFDIPTSVDQFMVPNKTANALAASAPGIASAGDTLFKVGLQDAVVQNNMAVKESETAALKEIQDLLYTGENAYLNTTGKDAKERAPIVQKQIDDIMETRVRNAQNDFQKQNLKNAFMGHSVNFGNTIGSHSAKETRNWEKGVVAGRIATAANQALVDPFNDPNVDASIKTARDNAKQAAILNNSDPEVAAAEAESSIRAAVTTLHINQDPRRGLAYFDKYKDKMDAKDLLRMDAQVTSARDQIKTDAVVDKYAPSEGKSEIYQSFIERGYTPDQAAAATGFLSGESATFDPNAVNPRDGRDKSDSIGITQWNSTRAKQLKEFAAKEGKPHTDRATQIKFLHEELGGTEAAAGKALKGAKNIEEAISAMTGFVRPGTDPKTGKIYGYDERLRMAKSIRLNEDTVVKGRDKAADQAQAIEADPNIQEHIKKSAISKVMQTSRLEEMRRVSMLKAAQDNSEATSFDAQSGTISATEYSTRMNKSAELAASGGDVAAFKSYTYLASKGDLMTNFAKQPLDKQKEMIASMQTGVAAKMAAGTIAVDKEQRTQEIMGADAQLDVLKKGAKDGLDPSALEGVTKSALEVYLRHNQTQKAIEARDIFRAYAGAKALTGQPRLQAEEALRLMEDQINKQGADPHGIRVLEFMKQMNTQAETEFKKDPMAATIKIAKAQGRVADTVVDFSKLDTLPAQLATRMNLSENGKLWSGRPVPIFTVPEMDQLSTTFDGGSLAVKQTLTKTLAVNMLSGDSKANDHFMKLATDLTAKGAAGQGMTGAMLFYSKQTPEDTQIANRIIKGNDLLVKGGDAGKDAAPQDNIWRYEINERLGNVMVGKDGDFQAVVRQSIKALYAEQQGTFGGAGQPTDTTKLVKAIEDAVGTIVDFNGQKTVMPDRGMTRNDFKQRILNIPEEITSKLRSDNGTPINRYALMNNSQFVSVGDGLYSVMMPEAKTGIPAQVRDPNDRSKPWVVNLKAKGVEKDLGIEGAPIPATVMPGR